MLQHVYTLHCLYFFCVIRLYIRHENLHKINNADIILDYSDIHGFYGMIKTKSQYLAANLKNYYCKVNASQKALQNFKEWAIKWQQKISQQVFTNFHVQS